MDFGQPGQGAPKIFDAGVAADMSALASAMTPEPSGLEWDAGSCVDIRNTAPAVATASPFGAFPLQTMGYPSFTGLGTAAAAMGGVEAPKQQLPVQSGINSADSLLMMAQKTTRAARNGREQQRAQKISDVIDKLKGMLDKAKFTSGDSTSKLHVLTSCESYIHSLHNRTRCYDMEAKLRSASRGNNFTTDVNDSPTRYGGSSSSSSSGSSSSGGGATTENNDVEWAKKVDGNQSDESRSVETDNLDKAGDGAVRGGESSDTRDAFFDEENSVGSSSSSSGSGIEITGPFARPLSSSATESGAGSSVEDGDMGSTDGGGAGTSVSTTDSGSQGFTTDTASRGFTTDSGYTDSSFGGDSGSADSSGDAGSGDAGSADGGSDGSEEETPGSWMRVVNYFDIFRLSSVPMAIASKDGALVDVNDAMRGFGRIDQDTVKTLTVKSLVAPESSQALEAAMGNMLASGLQVTAGGPEGGGSQPFLANAGIGDRPTLLTVSLVYDERGEASAFHVALIPRSKNPAGGHVEACCSGSSTKYTCEAPCLGVNEVESGARGGNGTLGKRSLRFSEAGGQKKLQKRQAV